MPASFIQSKNGLSSAAATVSLTDNGGSTIATTAGDWLLVDIVYINSGASRTISAAPTAAGTFVQVGTPYYVSDVGRIWGYIPNCLAVTNALQFTLSASCSNIGLYVGQVRGLSAFAGDNGNVKQTNPGTGAGAITASLTVPSMSCYVWGNAWARNIASWLSTQSDTAESPVWNASGNPQHGRSTAPGTRSLTWTATNGTDDFYKLAMAFTESAQILPAVSTFHPGRSPGYSPQSGRFFQVPSSYALAAPSGAIAGTDGITFGQSGTLTGSGALAGTAALTFGQSGNLTAAGALAGTASITFGQTGAVTGAGALAGTSALIFGQSGALTGAGALAGSATITFNATGTLDQPSGALAGSAAITFGQTGALLGSGALVGSAALTFAQSGALTGAGTLAGSTTLVFSQTGTLAGIGALVGSIPLTFGQSGTLTGAGALAGSTTLTFAASGTLDQPAGSMQGTASLTFNATGTLISLTPAFATSDGGGARETDRQFEARLFRELALQQATDLDPEDRGSYRATPIAPAGFAPASIATPASTVRRYDDEIMAILWMLM